MAVRRNYDFGAELNRILDLLSGELVRLEGLIQSPEPQAVEASTDGHWIYNNGQQALMMGDLLGFDTEGKLCRAKSDPDPAYTRATCVALMMAGKSQKIKVGMAGVYQVSLERGASITAGQPAWLSTQAGCATPTAPTRRQLLGQFLSYGDGQRAWMVFNPGFQGGR